LGLFAEGLEGKQDLAKVPLRSKQNPESLVHAICTNFPDFATKMFGHPMKGDVGLCRLDFGNSRTGRRPLALR
jgi:hypothetical protein